ncbi:hypothetical protein [Winogradskyella sp. A2]|uniref:hypothetical protein n=1 Tax=Winogradskyella sp. A2 TaxID=3366944 RepID=UPI00398C6B81
MVLNNRKISLKARVLHRYLGFFLAGVMAMYAISGIIMIFRETNFLKTETVETRQLEPNLVGGELSPKLRMGVKVDKQEGDILYFEEGNYNQETWVATVKKMKLPFVLEKMERLHKATTDSPLYFFNIFFGLSLLLFVLSAFWMFLPSMPIFKKGIYYAIGGVILTLIMLFL